jgi:hypothetical protein
MTAVGTRRRAFKPRHVRTPALDAPRPDGRGRALPRGPEVARAPEPRLAVGLRLGCGRRAAGLGTFVQRSLALNHDVHAPFDHALMQAR